MKATIRKQRKSDDYDVICGGDPENPTWAEYVAYFKLEGRQRVGAVRAAVDRQGFVGSTGGNFCNDHVIEFDDGVLWGFTWRAWGDLQQAIEGKRSGYMKFYM